MPFPKQALFVALAAALVVPHPARGQTPCQECWTDSCQQFKGLIPKCKSGSAPKPTARTVTPQEEIAASLAEIRQLKAAAEQATRKAQQAAQEAEQASRQAQQASQQAQQASQQAQQAATAAERAR